MSTGQGPGKRGDVQPREPRTEPAVKKTRFCRWWHVSSWHEKLGWGWLAFTTVWLIVSIVGCERWWSFVVPAMLLVGAVMMLFDARKRRLNKQD